MNKWDKLILFRKKMVLPWIFLIMRWISGATYIVSVMFLFAVVCEYGFTVSASMASLIDRFFNVVWGIFLLNATLKIIVGEPDGKAKITGWTILTLILLYLTLLPVVFLLPEEDSGVQWVWLLFNSQTYRSTVFTILSLTQLSGGFVHLMGKHTNPSIILASSFLIIIIIGTALLMLPEINAGGISWVDALFTATSATCVTGLNTLDITQAFTDKGQTVILLLFQIGGLGVMTFTSFFAMFFMGKTSLYNQLAIGDMISSNSLNSLFSTLLYILGFTLAVEGVGAVLIWLDIHGSIGLTDDEEIMFAVFHSVSGFCNAGFSNMHGGFSAEPLMSGHLWFYVIILVLVIGGSIGFPILVNLLRTGGYNLKLVKWYLLKTIFRRKQQFPRRVHLYNLNTKIVFIMSAVLIFGGALVFGVLEWNVSLAGMPTVDKVVHSIFNVTCPRSAGIASLSFTGMTTQTVLLVAGMMVIGGGTQSMAGGVKMNVMAVVLINLWAVLRGAERVTVFRRELSRDSIQRSNAALILYLILLSVGIFVMTLVEPEASLLGSVFECISALSTVGSSLDFTPGMGTGGKLLIVVMMFIGRVGAFTLASGLIHKVKKQHFRYPSDNIIIN